MKKNKVRKARYSIREKLNEGSFSLDYYSWSDYAKTVKKRASKGEKKNPKSKSQS